MEVIVERPSASGSEDNPSPTIKESVPSADHKGKQNSVIQFRIPSPKFTKQRQSDFTQNPSKKAKLKTVSEFEEGDFS